MEIIIKLTGSYKVSIITSTSVERRLCGWGEQAPPRGEILFLGNLVLVCSKSCFICH